jgi:hypothetical protein
MSTPTNLVTLTPVDPPGPGLRFHMDGDDDLTGGLGGWIVNGRPRRRGSPEWEGVPPFQLTLPLYTDGHDVAPGRNESVEPKIVALIRLALKVPGGFQPPLVEVSGPTKAPWPGMRWAINDIRWGEQIRRSDGQRVFQAMTVVLLEHVTAEVLLGPAAQARARS